MAVLLPVSGLLADRFSPKAVYASGIAAYAVVVFPAFALFGTGSIVAYAMGMVLAFGVIHAWFYGAQGTLYASLFPTRTRYTGLVDGVSALRCLRLGPDPADPHGADRRRWRHAVAGVRISGGHRGHQRHRHRCCCGPSTDQQAQHVSTCGPASVIATVFSVWAVRDPSADRMVQPSRS